MFQPNPYQSPEIPAESPVPSRRPGEDALYFAAQCHNIVGGLGFIFVSLAMFGILFRGGQKPLSDTPVARFQVVTVAIMVPQSLLMLAGGISMHQHKRRWLAIAGAWAGILPFCGCYVFSLFSGIWALMVLWRPEVKALFVENQPSNSE
ncbi:MAG: hypothetical protein ACKVP0_03050 [Pirellulaceae bacterium]